MRRFLAGAFLMLTGLSAVSQTDTATKEKKAPPVTLPRSGDHFVIQLGYTMWQGKPEGINTGGLSRTANVYFMLDYPFKTNPHWSAAIGAGVGTDNVFFDKTYIGIKDNTDQIIIRDVSDTNHFKKYKLATAYLEAPVELRFRSNPDNDAKSLKFAVGAKVGLLVNAHTKGKNLEDKNGRSIGGYTLKENSKTFFNRNRLAVTGRVGYGHFSLFTTYQVNTLFKEARGPIVRPLTIGLTISGL
ncbi:MAG TPA: outer membrane beta-barrel protein [Chitinophagaceae bacterium]|nr:outer membrane beta-barrel protein [Chitinophagaceae bacterium]